HSLDLAAFGSVYQSLFALSGAALQQSGPTPLHASSITSSPENKLKSPTDGRVRLSGLLPFSVVDDTDERPFPCQFCESRFKKKQHLQNHERIHTGEKYLCSICGQGFSRRHILKHHIYRKHLSSPRGGLPITTSGSSPKSTHLAGNSSMSPPSYPLAPLLQSNASHTSKANNVHRSSCMNPESNGDDASASSNDAAILVVGSSADDDSALMDDLPETVASLLSSAAAP
ncbi:Zinc finger C2H2-type, partial [Trinorchestia longiramus]